MNSAVHFLSPLCKTWIFDLDGTIVKHNGYLLDGEDTLLEGVKDFFDKLPANDMVILVTSRKKEYRQDTEFFLRSHGIRYDSIVFEAPFGERILINDRKPSGLETALAINATRDSFIDDVFEIDPRK